MPLHEEPIKTVSDFRVECLDPIIYSAQLSYRAQTRRQLLILCISFLSSVSLFVLSRIFPSGSYVSIVLGIPAFLASILTVIMTTHLCTRRVIYKTQLQSSLISACCGFISPDLTHIPRWFVSKNHFKASNLFYSFPDLYSGDSLIDGFVHSIHFRASFVHASYKIRKMYVRVPIIKYRSFFDGLCVALTLPHSSNNDFYCIPRFHSLLSINADSYTSFLTSHEELDNTYIFLSQDGTISESMKNAVTSFILHIYQETAQSPLISFRDKVLFIALNDSTVSFNTKFSGELIHRRATEKYCYILQESVHLAQLLSSISQ